LTLVTLKDYPPDNGPFAGTLLVKGSASLGDGFPKDLNSRSTLIPDFQGSGIGKVIIDISGLDERYFVRLEPNTSP
jgi:hypothetical protein